MKYKEVGGTRVSCPECGHRHIVTFTAQEGIPWAFAIVCTECLTMFGVTGITRDGDNLTVKVLVVISHEDFLEQALQEQMKWRN